MTELCRPPEPLPTASRFEAPEAATDCHLHIFGPETSQQMLTDNPARLYGF